MFGVSMWTYTDTFTEYIDYTEYFKLEKSRTELV